MMMLQTRAGPAFERLADGEAHVWIVALDSGEGGWPLPESVAGVLSRDETARASRFRQARDRQHYVGAHGALRHILSRYVPLAPGELAFTANAYGKPSLANDESGGVQFNLSHAGNLALVAVAHGRPVGVDVEPLRTDFVWRPIAESFFSAHERRCLNALPSPDQHRGFLNCWTRKEAFIKAVGEGLTLPLASFDVSLAPGEPARLLEMRHAGAGDWSLRDINVGDGYVAALAVQGAIRDVACRTWSAAWSR